MISNKMQQVLGALFAGVLIATMSTAATAATKWQQNHPRRVEVNHRLGNLNSRIHQERASGKITGAQAAAMHHENHQIRTEERALASQNGGHLTRGEQAVLNHQENTVSAQLGH